MRCAAIVSNYASSKAPRPAGGATRRRATTCHNAGRRIMTGGMSRDGDMGCRPMRSLGSERSICNNRHRRPDRRPSHCPVSMACWIRPKSCLAAPFRRQGGKSWVHSLDPSKRDQGGSLFPRANAVWALRAGHFVTTRDRRRWKASWSTSLASRTTKWRSPPSAPPAKRWPGTPITLRQGARELSRTAGFRGIREELAAGVRQF